MKFRDRKEAGRRLATRLVAYRGQNPVVLGLPRGGVPVADQVAIALTAPLDIVVVRKIAAPDQPELGIGAVAGDDSAALLDRRAVERLRVPQAYLEAEIGRQREEGRRRDARYREGRPPHPLEGRTAIVVDDGIATGGSMRAALHAVRGRGPARVVVAVPVAPGETIEALRAEGETVVCLETPRPFDAVGRHYEDFRAPEDDEVAGILGRAHERAALEARLRRARRA